MTFKTRRKTTTEISCRTVEHDSPEKLETNEMNSKEVNSGTRPKRDKGQNKSLKKVREKDTRERKAPVTNNSNKQNSTRRKKLARKTSRRVA